MALATVNVRESNGVGPLSTTDLTNDGTGRTDYTASDGANTDPGTFPVVSTVNAVSFEKWHRFRVIINDSDSISNLKFFRSAGAFPSPVGVEIRTNATQSSYSNQAFVTPAQTSLICVHLATDSQPAGPNVGISGSLTASIFQVDGLSDYLVHQLAISVPADARRPSGDLTLSWIYDEVA